MSVANFPAPLKHEHLMSCLMRYAVWQSSREYLKIAKHVSPSVSVVGNHSYWRSVYTDVISQYLPKFHLQIAQEHSLLLVYAKITGQDFTDLLRLQLISPTKLSFLHANIEQVQSGWKWCPECAREDEELSGFPYWHVDHQLSLKKRCSVHGNLLLSRCNHCGFAWKSILAGVMRVSQCPGCGKNIRGQRKDTEFDIWIENVANDILTGQFSFKKSEIQNAFKNRYGLFEPKRFWSLAERKHIAREQVLFNTWLDKLELSNHVVPVKGNKPLSERLAFNVSSFVFSDNHIAPLVSLLFKRYWEEVLC